MIDFRIRLTLLLSILCVCSCSDTNRLYKNGIVVSAHPDASQVGLAILKQGGNAIDASIAVQFALAVVYPNAGNIGGGGFLVYRGADGSTNSLDFREKAPLKADANMYLDNSGEVLKNKSLYGALAVGVPGTVDGMVKAHLRYGKLAWKDLLSPAIALAENGFKLTGQQADELNALRNKLLKFNPQGSVLIKPGGDWKSGDVLVQPELAATLKLIRDNGRAGFYKGKTAHHIIQTMNELGGLINQSDLDEYQAVWRKPLIGKYKSYQIITMPPPSSGGIALIQLLQSVENYPLKQWGFHKDSTIQLMVEAERRTYADRATYLGDPDFSVIPVKQLTDARYQKERLKDFDFGKATPSTQIKAGDLLYESEETTHYSIVDKDGNAVSVTTTLNGSYGSMVVVSKSGFLLNNEMDDFSVKPGSPNLYGLVGGRANAIEPRKRMLSSMTPTILEKNGELFMVVGSPGGSTIITSVFQTVLNVVEFGMSIQGAVTAKRFHHQWLPDKIFIEDSTFSDNTLRNLKLKGYEISPRGPIGRVDAVVVTNKGYAGGADPRGNDTCLGW